MQDGNIAKILVGFFYVFIKFDNKLNVAKILTTLLKSDMVENGFEVNMSKVLSVADVMADGSDSVAFVDDEHVRDALGFKAR